MRILGTIYVRPALDITNLNIIIIILTCVFISYALGSFFSFHLCNLRQILNRYIKLSGLAKILFFLTTTKYILKNSHVVGNWLLLIIMCCQMCVYMQKYTRLLQQ